MFDSVFVVPVVAIVGAFTYAIVQAMTRARVRELEIRERIALIERGLVPAPEADPKGFENAMNRYGQVAAAVAPLLSDRAARHRRAGITLVGLGLGLMVLISVAGDEPSAGLGVGGFVAILGLAFFINSLFEARQRPVAPLPASTPPATPSVPGRTE